MNIKAIADLAGVSKASVSRVLNNHPSVSRQLREKVEKVISDHGYEPNAVARALAKRQTRTIGLVIPRPAQYVFGHPFHSDILRGVGMVLESEGYTFQVHTSAGPDMLAAIRRDRSCDGILVSGVFMDDPLVRRLKGLDSVPVVAMNQPSPRPSVPFVTMDDEHGAYMATMHLIERGHTKLMMMNGPAVMYSVNRLKGFKKALRRSGIPFQNSMIISGEYSIGSGRALMEKILSLPEPPTAIFAASDYLGLGALFAANEKGVRVPEDIAIVGMDNFPISAMVAPPLTTVDVHAFDVGFQAARLLLRLISGERPSETQIVLPTHLVVRKST